MTDVTTTVPEYPRQPEKPRRAIEALRSGVPSRDAVRALGSSAPDIEDRFQHLLGAVSEQPAEVNGPTGLLVAGNFGSGKSHLLESLHEHALTQRFVTSKIVISKETPLYDPVRLFRTASAAARLPDRRGAALPLLAEALNPRSDPFRAFDIWVQQARPDVLNQRFAATLYLFEAARQDPELYERILGFWGGDPLGIGDLKRALRSQGEGASYLFEKIDPRSMALQRFRFMARLILAAGYRGWVLLVDEVELLGRYSLIQRARSYAELARWSGAGAKGEAYPGMVTVFALTSDFEAALLDARRDRENVPNKLQASTREADSAIAAQAERGMRLIGRAMKVPVPSRAMVRRTYEKVRALHGEAYGWEPPPVGSAPYASSTSMREYIRWWITEWDLKRIYPDYQPEIEIMPLTLEYAEDADLEAPFETLTDVAE